MNINGARANISIQDYWKECRKIQSTLPDVVKLVSVPDERLSESQRGGVHFVECESLVAAKCLFAGSHRLATPEEIAAQEQKRIVDIKDRARKHLSSQGIVSITLPQ